MHCGWKNAEKWVQCAKCGRDRLTDADLQLVQRIRPEADEICRQIEAARTSGTSKWQYLILAAGRDTDKAWRVSYRGESRPYRDLDDILAEVGADGWELLGVATFVGSEQPSLSSTALTASVGLQFFFKRSIAPLPEKLEVDRNRIVEQLPDKLRVYFPALR